MHVSAATMKLSEAIRLGAMLKPQGFGGDSFHSSVVACAMAAAADAVGIPDLPRWELSEGRYTAVERQWPWLTDCGACPACTTFADDEYLTLVWHLNDTHRWTREQIADWVEELERARPPAIEDAPALANVCDE